MEELYISHNSIDDLFDVSLAEHLQVLDLEANNVSAVEQLKYLRRMEEEFQVIFCVTLARHKTKKQIAFTNNEFALWAADNEDLL